MSFHISNTGLTLTIAQSLRQVRNDLFAGPVPRTLHHYTHAQTVEAIIQSRALWAIPIQHQEDKSEISHAAGIVGRLAEQMAGEDIPPFAVEVLRRLPFYMEERKDWVFIACFCDDGNSDLHWKRYGEYCLTFPAPWTGMPALKLLDTQADCWYQRVIYNEDVQRRAMIRALGAVVGAMKKHTKGENVGPWAGAMRDSCARNTAQLLLGIASGFKRRGFAQEREWRIVCAPRLGSNSSAPTSIDDAFNGNVGHLPRRHVSLQIHLEQQPFQPLLIPPVPFTQCRRDPGRYQATELQRINALLGASKRPDLFCM